MAVGGTSRGLSNAAVATSPDGSAWTVTELPTSQAPANYSLAAVLSVGTSLYAIGDNAGNKHIVLKSIDNGATWSIAHEATVTGNALLAGIAASSARIVTVGGVTSVTLP